MTQSISVPTCARSWVSIALRVRCHRSSTLLCIGSSRPSRSANADARS